MVLSDKDLEAFRALYREHFGKNISSEETYESAIKLLTLLKAIYKPMTVEQFEKIQKRRAGLTDSH